jgi:streptomycin 6-kinase
MDKFKDNVIKLYKDQGQAWLDSLPSIVSDLANEWNLTSLVPVDNLSFNYVLSGLQNLRPVILKLSFKQEDLEREMEALKCFAGFGGVPVLEYQNNAVLLQKAMPGESLKNYLPNGGEGALLIACDVARKLHQSPIQKSNSFLTIEERLSYIDRGWNIPADHLQRARIFKEEVLKVSTVKVLLHGDLHHDNIVSDGKDWLVIDPKGVIGCPINEVWAFVQDLDKDLPIIAKEFGFDIKMLAKCYYTHAVLAACWSVEDNLDPGSFLKLADEAKQVLF